MIRTTLRILSTATVTVLTHAALAQVPVLPTPVVPFVADFESGTQNFGGANDNFPADLLDADLTIDPVGGVGGSASLTTDFALNSPSEVVFRAESILDTAGLAFTGDWIAGGVSALSAFVTHDAPVPLGFGFRIATQTVPISDNFPGAFVLNLPDVAPNTLTKLTADISPANVFDPGSFLFGDIAFFEGGNFNSIFSEVTNVQVTVGLADGYTEITQEVLDLGLEPAGALLGDVLPTTGSFAVNGDDDIVGIGDLTYDGPVAFNTATEFTFGLDNVQIVPEPTAALLVTVSALAGVAGARRERG